MFELTEESFYKNMGLVIPSDIILYIFPEPKDKPIKLIFENNKDVTSSIRRRTQKETLIEIIKMLLHNNLIDYSDVVLTTAQYRSEKGKIRKGQFNGVMNFLKNRQLVALYNKMMSEDIPVMTISENYKFPTINSNFGIIKLNYQEEK